GGMKGGARRVLFVANGGGHRGVRLQVVEKPWCLVRRMSGMAVQAFGRVRTALQLRDTPSADNFTMQVPEDIGDITLRSLAQLCVLENERRLAIYDAELLRPRMVPTLVGLALRFVPGGTAHA